MKYREYQPHTLLRPYISCIWTLEEKVDPANFHPTVERILPDGQMEMIFHLGECFYQLSDGKKNRQVRSFIYGQLSQFLDLLPSSDTHLIAFRFFPFGLAPFVPISPKEFQQEYIPLDILYGQAGKDLEEQVNCATSIESAIHTIEQFLLKSMLRFHQPDPFIEHISKLIINSKGCGDIQDIIRSYNISPRHFQRKFLEITGTKSKTLARITRLQNALQLSQSKPEWSLTEISLATGYFDQAHFIRDFKRFAGMSPGQYFKHSYQLNEQFVSS